MDAKSKRNSDMLCSFKDIPKTHWVLKTKVFPWCYRHHQKARMNCHLHNKGKQFWGQSHPLRCLQVCTQSAEWRSEFLHLSDVFEGTSTEPELQTQKLGWSHLSLTVRVTMAINPFSNSPTYSIHAETLKYLSWKKGSERTKFEGDFIFFIRNFTFSGRDSSWSSWKYSNYCIFRKVFARVWEKRIFFDLTESLAGTHWTY